MRNLTSDFLTQTIEEYLKLDPNGDYILKSFYSLENQTLDELLETKKQELEDALLDWLWFAKPTSKKFGNNGNQIEIYFKNDLSLDIANGVYYFQKTFYKKDAESDNRIIFAIITPKTRNYDYFTSYLQKLVLESFNHDEEKQTILDNIDKVKTK